MSSEIVDLDAMLPDSKRVRFGGEIIEVLPPKTEEIFRLTSLGQKLLKADELENDKLEKLVADVRQLVDRCIPSLVGHPLGLVQQMAVVRLLNQMATPPDAEELEKRGITPSAPKENA